MEHHEQRRLAIKLAKAGGLTETVPAITGSCYEDILKEARNEVGVDKLVSLVLQGDPEWAYNTLRFVPNLGAHRDALLKKAAETPEIAIQTLRFIPDLGRHKDTLVKNAGTLADPLGRISSLSLLNEGGFVCWYTMYWINNGVVQPAGTKGSPVVWSPKMLINIFDPVVEACSYFAAAPSTAPLQAGNEVWMYVWVQAGKDNESPLHFTYDPNTNQIANFSISGGTLTNTIGFTGFTQSAARAAERVA